MRILLVLISLTILAASCNSKNNKSEKEQKDSVQQPIVLEEARQPLSEVIEEFTAAYLAQDNEKANAHIHPDLGLLVIYRPGAMDTFERVDSLDFKKPFPQHFPYTKFTHDFTLTFDKVPEYDCGYDRWNKLGFFADTTAHADQLSNIAAFQREFDEINDEQQEEIEDFEAGTYRVVLTKNENLIFHVKQYKGAWYVVVLDRAYGWCDA